MQAAGIINDHDLTCPIRTTIQQKLKKLSLEPSKDIQPQNKKTNTTQATNDGPKPTKN